jgi:hypothetical protein
VVLTVGPGTYAVNAIGVLTNIDPQQNPQFGICQLSGRSAGNLTGEYVPGGDGSNPGLASIPVQGIFRFPGNRFGTITLTCSGFNLDMSPNSSIQAIRVATAFG